jgi:YidC/Oxa1 family membrane protein insertase
MEKRLFLAMGLSMLVLLAYSSVFKKAKPVENNIVVSNMEATTSKITPPEPVLEFQTEKIDKSLSDIKIDYEFDSGSEIFKFSAKGGYIVEVVDKRTGIILPIKRIAYSGVFSSYLFDIKRDGESLVMTANLPDGSQASRRYVLTGPRSFRIEDSLPSPGKYDLSLGALAAVDPKDQVSPRYFEASSFVNGVVSRRPVHQIKAPVAFDGVVSWSALRERYYCSAAFPQTKAQQYLVSKDALGAREGGLTFGGSDSGNLASSYKTDIYVGPQDSNMMREFKPGADMVVNYGAFDPVAKSLMFVLRKCYTLTKNWGLAIILISVLVFVIFSPLSLKSMSSMKRMQAIQPMVEEIKKRHKDTPQKAQAEIMELYRKEKVNPLGGCLPMLIQLPVFVSLYQILLRFLDLKDANFLWIKDLSSTDRLFVFSKDPGAMFGELNILPILMAGTMFVQQKMSMASSSASSEMAEQQKMMSIMMPILFGVLFYKMASGLVLYWFTNSLLSVVFQWQISKKTR